MTVTLAAFMPANVLFGPWAQCNGYRMRTRVDYTMPRSALTEGFDAKLRASMEYLAKVRAWQGNKL